MTLVAHSDWRWGVSVDVFWNLEAILIEGYLEKYKMFDRIERFLAITEPQGLTGGQNLNHLFFFFT